MKDGWGHFTTNRVAERAGVNISSLYQYFPNKTAILEAVRESHIEQTRRALLDAVGSGEDPVRAMVRALIEAHRVAPELHRALTEELPHSLRADAECIDHPLLLSVVRGLFASAPDPEIAFFVARSALHAVVHDAACRRPSLLDERRFVAEVEHLARSLTNRRG